MNAPGKWFAALAAVLLAGVPAAAQERPFEQGETFLYQVSLGRFGSRGTGSLRVLPAEPVRGEPVVLLAFDFATRVGPFSISHRSRSWLSERRMVSLRYEVDERTPLKDLRVKVDLFPDEGRWRTEDASGRNASPHPLDELSYLYLLRTLPLDEEQVELSRHFDARRNPASVRVLGRETVRVPAGKFAAVLVEMKVRDPDRLGGEGHMRVHLSDDASRRLLRIESKVPMAGKLLLELLPETRVTRHP